MTKYWTDDEFVDWLRKENLLPQGKYSRRKPKLKVEPFYVPDEEEPHPLADFRYTPTKQDLKKWPYNLKVEDPKAWKKTKRGTLEYWLLPKWQRQKLDAEHRYWVNVKKNDWQRQLEMSRDNPKNIILTDEDKDSYSKSVIEHYNESKDQFKALINSKSKIPIKELAYAEKYLHK